MLNREVFLNDPMESTIPNDGVAKVGMPETPEQWDILAHELRMFVCEGEYARGLERIFSSYLSNVGKNVQPAVWVSGFYGSGKSHLVRVLEALWSDIEFPNGDTARNMVTLPHDIRDHLIELTTNGRRRGGLWSAAGTLSAAGDVSVRLAVLSVIFKSAGLPSIYHQARFVLFLKREGIYDAVVAELEATGKSLDYELENMLVSPPLAAALLHALPTLAPSPMDVGLRLENQFPQAKDISDDEFISALRSVLGLMSDKDGDLPCTLVVLDELQQFVGEDPGLILDLQNVVERCVESFKSTLLFVGTGQAELHATPQLQKLLGRFTVKVKLEDRDIEHVIREVILRKKETKLPDLERVLDYSRAEIDRQLQGTKIGPRSDDQQILASDYPLLPTRRRLWERVLRSVDAAGLAGQLRTQLRIVHDETRDVALRELGVVIPADRIYRHLESNMLNSSLLLREVSNRIEELNDGTLDGELRSRLCAMIFLIEQLPKEGVAETGVRATTNTLADLLIDDIKAGSAGLRQQIPVALKDLVDDGTLHMIDDEYHVQTAESREWQRDYNRRFVSARNNDVQIANDRTTAFRTAISAVLKNVRLRQGSRNESRSIDPQYGDTPPASGAGVPIWIPLAWTGTQNQFVNAAVEAGTNSAVVFVYLPRQNVDAIRDALASISAANETLTARGIPTTDEGRQARAGMSSRLEGGQGELNALVKGVLDNAHVFQGGGNEVSDGLSLAENVEAAAKKALDRLYPDFDLADHAGWPKVLERARQGSANALEAIGYAGPSQDHPVTRAITRSIGPGKTGADVRKLFTASPYGWPQDTIDGALVALVADGKLRATRDSRSLISKDLNQTTISRAEFRVEEIILTTAQKLSLAGAVGAILGGNLNVSEVERNGSTSARHFTKSRR